MAKSKKKKTVKKKTAKKKSIKTLKNKATKIFQLFIRLRDTDSEGNGNCCSCGREVTYLKSNAGHFASRSHIRTLFDEENVHIQCIGCNGWGGNPDGYALFMIEKYGVNKIRHINSKKKIPLKISVLDYEAIIESYNLQVDNIKNERGIE